MFSAGGFFHLYASREWLSWVYYTAHLSRFLWNDSRLTPESIQFHFLSSLPCAMTVYQSFDFPDYHPHFLKEKNRVIVRPSTFSATFSVPESALLPFLSQCLPCYLLCSRVCPPVFVSLSLSILLSHRVPSYPIPSHPIPPRPIASAATGPTDRRGTLLFPSPGPGGQ